MKMLLRSIVCLAMLCAPTLAYAQPAPASSEVSDAQMADVRVFLQLLAERQSAVLGPLIDIAASQMPSSLATRRYDNDAERDAARRQLAVWAAEFNRQVDAAEAQQATIVIPESIVQVADADPTFSVDAMRHVMAEQDAALVRLRAFSSTTVEIVGAAIDGRRDPRVASRAVMHLMFRDIDLFMAGTAAGLADIDQAPNSLIRGWGRIMTMQHEVDALVRDLSFTTLLGDPSTFGQRKAEAIAVARRLAREIETLGASVELHKSAGGIEGLSAEQSARMISFYETVMPNLTAYAQATTQWAEQWQEPTVASVMAGEGLDAPQISTFLPLEDEEQ